MASRECLCRFRFLFLERNSEFSSMSIKITAPSSVRDIAQHIERELNLLRRDALEVGLDKANEWADFVDWSVLLRMTEQWRSIEPKIRTSLADIRAGRSGSDNMAALRDTLAASVQELETSLKPLNTELIQGLTDKLKTYIHA